MRTETRKAGTAARITAISAGLMLASLGSIGSAAAATPQFTVSKTSVVTGEDTLVKFPGCTAKDMGMTTGAAVGTMDRTFQWPGYQATPGSANETQDSFNISFDKEGVYKLRGGCAIKEAGATEYTVLDYGYVTVTVTTPSALPKGEGLASGESIASNGNKLVMQGDGNLVAYDAAGKPTWMSGTFNNPGAHAEMQTDGNFVVYSAAGKALWQSGTSGRPGAEVRVNADGSVGVYVGADGPFWSSVSKPAANEIKAGAKFVAGQEIVSPNGTYKLALQGDGNMVVYKGNTALWQSGTGGVTGAHAEFKDGAFVVLDTEGKVRWSSGSTTGVNVVVQNDGNVVVYPASGAAVWQSGTAGK